ncbi:putative holin-like toxin [Paenibacillus sp. OAS669]|uniref:putative holin-like toxin n=1 Tax=Paenibacillus sp. OAS669 TaxID=2663821 RepID=UPI0039A270F7
MQSPYYYYLQKPSIIELSKVSRRGGGTLTTYESISVMINFGLFIVTLFGVIIALIKITAQNKK